MRKTKTRLELFSFYDHCGIAAHLEEQARKGWMLEKIGGMGWKYKKTEPRSVKFAVTYCSEASAYDPGPSEDLLNLLEYCDQAGWKLAASNAQMQVFWHEDPDATPLETDAVWQVENIHASAKKTVLRNQGWILALALLQMLVSVIRFVDGPVPAVTEMNSLFLVLCWADLMVLCLVEITSYVRWHRRAVEEAESSGILYPTRSHRFLQGFSLLLVTGGLLLWVGSPVGSRMFSITVASLIYMGILIVLVHGCSNLLKKWKVSAQMNILITILVDVGLAIAMITCISALVIRNDWGVPKPVDTYEVHGITMRVYEDELPLQVEDLMDVTSEDYSRQLQTSKTFLAERYICDQEHRRDRQKQPDLNYTLVVCRAGWLTDHCWNSWIKDLGGIRTESPPIADHQVASGYYDWLKAEDPTPWGADAVYRRYFEADPSATWLIRWGDTFVKLRFDEELTDGQKAVIGKLLGS